ncbi:MAG TPA: carboxypeptidase-like regulatory domain-containing protein [Vicinamibacterales bacterium]|nr:carboxypeptidase-like regulatory domain-containing protein [Vicinamibacterales bacterium]
MTRTLRFALAAAIATTVSAQLGCGQPSTMLPSPSAGRVEIPTFTLRGRVTDVDAMSVGGATVTLQSGRMATTAADGTFDFGETVGIERVRAWKTGFLPGYGFPAPSAGEAFLTIALEPGERLSPPTAIHSAIDLAVDRPCDPEWDARAPCRRYVIATDVDIDLTAELSWIGPADLVELMLYSTDTDDRQPAQPTGAPGNTVSLTARLRAGQVFELRVLAYYDCDGFDLRVTSSRPAN